MNIYNSLTRKVEKFTPNEDNIVRMYTCGPTVYHYAHIGNLRTYIFEDILEKGLEYLGYTVLRVMNVTDVGHLENDSDDGEDKMQKSAAREKKSAYEIADFYERAFFSDCAKLNIRKPSVVERATKQIDTYIEMIESLLDKGFAYKSNGNIYFGHWFNGYKHGFGIMNYANGNVYEGYWEDDNKHSKGTMKYENGDVYKGLWQFDSIYYGKMYYNNGNIKSMFF